MTRKWIKVNDLSNGQYSVNRNISFKPPMLRSDLCEYSDAYNVVKGATNFKTDENNDMPKKVVVLKNNVPFSSCVLTINNTLLDFA